VSPETVRWVVGILATLFIAGATIMVTVLLSVLNRKNDTIEKLREANLNYRLALIQLGTTAEAVNKTPSALPIPQTDGSGT
jgi:hypothetical protein